MNTLQHFLALSSISVVIFCTFGTSQPYVPDPRIFLVIPTQTNSNSMGVGSSFLDLPGQPCSSRNIFTGRIENGTCRKYLQCLISGQRISGGCTLGLTTCCVPRHLLFVNPVPVSSQTYRIKPLSSNYCQVRYDFETLTLEDPTADGNCISGKLVFTGQKDPSVPIICGQNSGQHMYLNFNNNAPITLTITTSSLTSTWRIKATKILCGDKVNLAPSGCLQYFKGRIGTVKSFNYRDVVATSTNQLSNQNYKICLDTTTSATSVTWNKPTTAASYFFTLSSNPTAIGPLGPPVGDEAQLSFGGTNCPNDYVIIKSGVFTIGGVTHNEDRFCGLGFPSSGIKAPNPFEMQYLTNGIETSDAEANNNGFFLSYTLT